MSGVRKSKQHLITVLGDKYEGLGQSRGEGPEF